MLALLSHCVLNLNCVFASGAVIALDCLVVVLKERFRSSDEAQVFTTCEHTRVL